MTTEENTTYPLTPMKLKTELYDFGRHTDPKTITVGVTLSGAAAYNRPRTTNDEGPTKTHI